MHIRYWPRHSIERFLNDRGTVGAVWCHPHAKHPGHPGRINPNPIDVTGSTIAHVEFCERPRGDSSPTPFTETESRWTPQFGEVPPSVFVQKVSDFRMRGRKSKVVEQTKKSAYGRGAPCFLGMLLDDPIEV